MHRALLRRLGALAVGGSIVATLYALSAPRWPDDWDGIGFISSMQRLDLDRFTPHPPGYPVYVVLLRASAAVFGRGVTAANAVAVASGVAVVLLAAAAAGRTWGARQAVAVGAALAVTPLVWRSCSGVGSEAPALAFTSLALFGMATFHGARSGAARSASAATIGIAVGLALGVRLSWAPGLLLLLVVGPRAARARAAAWATLASLAWAVPLAAIVGPSHLAALLQTHAEGHLHRWGGTILAAPEAPRATMFARAIFVDGLGIDATALGIAIALSALSLVATALRWRAERFALAWRFALPLLAYAAWVYLGQNIAEQPRHLLPVVAALAFMVGIAATASRVTAALGVTLLVLLAVRGAGDAAARRTAPPPGASLVADVERLTALSSPEGCSAAAPCVVAFGGRSARFFELSGTPASGRTAGSLGDVLLELGRLPRPPRRVLVTNELEGLTASTFALAPFATHCRPERLQRKSPCLEVYELRAPFLLPP